MKVIIVEDELAASDNLTYLLQSIDPTIEVIKVLDSVASSVKFLSKPIEAQLIFMDIHLADGISFEIFDQLKIDKPVIFTTAYDQYALKAFKVNSIDYLLKPIDEEELSEALIQFKEQRNEGQTNVQMEGLLSLIKERTKTYKTSYLLNQRDQMVPLKTENIACFHIDMGIVKVVSTDKRSFSMDTKLEDIEDELDPTIFYRINRQFIVNKNAISNIKIYFNGKLLVTLEPKHEERIIVSKAKATEFKNWMNS